MKRVWFFLRDEQAATAVEYAVMLAAILLTAIAAISQVGAQSGGMWGGIQSHLEENGFGSSG